MVRQRRGEEGRGDDAEEKDLKESGTKAEGRDTGGGQRRLIWHSVTSQTLNRLRSLWKVGAGEQRRGVGRWEGGGEQAG